MNYEVRFIFEGHIFLGSRIAFYVALDVCKLFIYLTFMLHFFLCWIQCSIVQVELKEGPLDQFSHEMEPFLRKQGMPVRLNKGRYLLPPAVM